MPQIIPIRDLRDTIKVSEMCNSSKEPVFITKNGYGDMVIMSMATYEEMLARVDIYNKVMESKGEIESGEYSDGGEVMARLKAKYAE